MYFCLLCEKQRNSEYYEFQCTSTIHSMTPLVTILEQLVNDLLILETDIKQKICDCCYNLFNELDQIEIRSKEIKQQLVDFYNTRTIGKLISLDGFVESRRNITFESVIDEQKPECDYEKFDLDNHRLLEDTDLKTIFNLKLNKTYADVQENNNCSLPVIEETVAIDHVDLKVEDKLTFIGKRGRKKQTAGPLKPYQCTRCSKTWKSMAELKNHILSHSQDRPYICEICGQGYKHKSALSVHVGMHKGINPFTCIYCNKSFTQKGALMRHTPIHTGEKPFQCDLCGRCFVHHTSFNIHRLSHTGQKSYKCETCGLALISGSHLKRHMRVHTGEKKYSCITCGRRFAEKYNLAAHEKLHIVGSASTTRKRKYRCLLCENSYEKKVKLDEHLLKDHKKTS